MTRGRAPKPGQKAAPARGPDKPASPPPPTPAAVVLDEGRHYAVLDKPAGVTVVKARGVPAKTLLDLAEDRYGKGVRPVHRLDKPTTGCCVVARTEYGQQALSEAFRRHLVDKRYLAVIQGQPPWNKMAIDARLLRVDRPDAKKGPLAIQTVDDAGQRALTRVRVLAKGEGISLVEARPETGRMHQIRVHLAHVGFPLVGDPIYSDASSRDDEGGLLLHAWAISFPSPDGGRRFVTAPVPKQMRERLAAKGVDVQSVLEPEREKFLAAAKSAPAKTAPSKCAPEKKGVAASPRRKSEPDARAPRKGKKGPPRPRRR